MASKEDDRMLRLTLALALLVGGVTTGVAQQTPQPAQRPANDSSQLYILEPLEVGGKIDDLTGVAVSASQGFVGFQDFRLRPLTREGELLENVPGLIMTQHSGDGKANQMFVRGFNLDHGTDFATHIEGMPVNVPTHAHGQGYTDLNFIIPELVDHVEYRLGTYYSEIGDFGAAGGAILRLRRSLPVPLLLAEAGENGFRRVVAAGSPIVGPGQLLVGGELKRYDGPWLVAQNLRKISGLARYSWDSGQNSFSILAMGYDNVWAPSDQIPLRLVESGELDRFGQVDPTLTGSSSRFSLSGTWLRGGANSSQRLDVYAIRYNLDLYSNFTFGLEDPDDGDQIQQQDDGRRILGANLAHVQPIGGRHSLTAGVQTRLDLANVALRRTHQRQLIEPVRVDEVTQWSMGAYAELRTEWRPSLRSVLGLRGDYYHFDVLADISENSGKTRASILSPKASLIYSPRRDTELYLSGGLGFHSNDARGVFTTIDPLSGEQAEPVHPLVRARGAELGMRVAPSGSAWRSTATFWTIDLDSELLFVGDAGTTEPQDRTRRLGLTITNFYRFSPRFAADLDVSLARARFVAAEPGEDRIPGALENVVTAGITWEPEQQGPFATLRLRHFGDYPLIEDNSERATGTSLLNLNLGWAFGPRLRLGLSVLNVLDSKAYDIQYFYASRVPGEPTEGVEDMHFHPVEPRQVRLGVRWGF
jgi:outer membrane receptor protein involved in Fe transport